MTVLITKLQIYTRFLLPIELQYLFIKKNSKVVVIIIIIIRVLTNFSSLKKDLTFLGDHSQQYNN